MFSSNEMVEVLVNLVTLAIKLEHCYPEVGFGPNDGSIAIREMKKLSFNIPEPVKTRVMKEITG